MTKLATQELTCNEALEILSASFDGEAEVHELDAVAVHLLACTECRAMAEAMESDDALLREAASGLHRAPSSPRWRPLAWGVGLAAAALLAVGLWRVDPAEPPAERIVEPVAGPVATPEDDSLEARLEAVQAQIEALQAGRELPPAPTAAPRANPFRSRKANPFTDSTGDTGLGPSPFARSSIFDTERKRRASGSSTPT